MDQAELAESLLTEEEINAGAQIVISVEKAELSEQQKELFQNAMSGYQEGVYLDISLFKVLNDQSSRDHGNEKAHPFDHQYPRGAAEGRPHLCHLP